MAKRGIANFGGKKAAPFRKGGKARKPGTVTGKMASKKKRRC